jgi:hypothetical protein
MFGHKKLTPPQDLPEEMQEYMVDKVGELVFTQVIELAMKKLSPEDQSTLETMMDEDESFYELIKFLEGKIPDFEKLVHEEGIKVAKKIKEYA